MKAFKKSVTDLHPYLPSQVLGLKKGNENISFPFFLPGQQTTMQSKTAGSSLFGHRRPGPALPQQTRRRTEESSVPILHYLPDNLKGPVPFLIHGKNPAPTAASAQHTLFFVRQGGRHIRYSLRFLLTLP